MACYRVHAGGIWSGGKGSREWDERSVEQTQRNQQRFEMMVELLDAVAQHSKPPVRRAAHQRLALYAYLAAKRSAELGDKPAIRRNLAWLWRVRRLPPGRSVRSVARLAWQSR
jgi:hypothetical protein